MVPLLAGAFLGCARTAPIVEPPLPEQVERIVTGPLPGADSTVIQDVAEAFDSTFVASEAERQAQRDYLEGHTLVDRVDSILTRMMGPSALSDVSTDQGVVDTAAFAVTSNEARQVLVRASHAQVAKDSMLVQSLLRDAQRLFERAVSLNPRHEEARYQLAQVYTIRAKRFYLEEAWEEVLKLLRELVQLRANEHGIWAEMAIVLKNLGKPAASALAWLQAAEVVLDDARLAFELVPPPADSTALFTYNVQAYRAFVDSRNGAGVRHSLAEAWKYATSEEESDFARRELTWAQWDYNNFENRLVFDSLRSAASIDPLGVRAEMGTLMAGLTRPSARREARYNHAVLSYDNGFKDGALDTLKALWHNVTDSVKAGSAGTLESNVIRSSAVRQEFLTAVDSLAMDPLPYPEFMEDLRATYATFLFERALAHRQEGASALAFTYLMQVAKTGSEYTGRAYIEALKLARYNPQQALVLEPRVEAIYSKLEREDQLAYLAEMGNLYRRLGKNEKVSTFLERYRELRTSN